MPIWCTWITWGNQIVHTFGLDKQVDEPLFRIADIKEKSDFSSAELESTRIIALNNIVSKRGQFISCPAAALADHF
jgi:hypothetical protein